MKDLRGFIKKTIREFLNENVSGKFIIGKCYEYDDLNTEIQKDIDKQFKKNSLEDDEDPDMDYPHFQQPLFDDNQDEYVYCFKFLNKKEILEKYPEVYHIGGRDSDYVNYRLIPSIKKNGLKNPPVGSEGNHRAFAYIVMEKPMPYFEIVKK